jgi:hypothetical protein
MGACNLIQRDNLCDVESLPASLKRLVDVASYFDLCLGWHVVAADKKECGVGFDVCCESDLDDVVDSMECFEMPSAQRGASRLEECAQDYHVGTLCNCV